MRRTVRLLALTATIVTSIVAVSHAETLVLASAGKTDYQVVLPATFHTPEIGRWLTNAAELVQTAFRTNGFDIAIATEGQHDPDTPGIYLGDTAFAREHGVNVAAFNDWRYVHRVAGRDVILAGLDRSWQATPPPTGWRWNQARPRVGTVKAVTDFLHRYAGTRFLYPTATGVEYLPVNSITLPGDLDYTRTPAIRFINSQYAHHNLYLVANNYVPPVNAEVGVHTWPRAIPANEYRETNPEYFALINNKRIVRAPQQYCISNAEVRDLIYQDMLDHADRGFTMVGLGQPDGFMACQCEDCYVLYGTGDDWEEKIWILHRNLAERFAKDRPGTQVVIISYGHTWAPPKTFKVFPDNVIIMLCRMSPELMAQWHECTVPGGYIGYLYIWGPYNTLGYTPQRTPTVVESLVRKYHDLGLTGIRFDGYGQAFGLEGPNYYVFGRMFDDPAHLEARDLLEEFYEAAFREVSTSMRRFYNTLYHAVQFACDMPYSYVDAYGRKQSFIRSHDDKLRLMAFLYPPTVLAELDAHLRRAEQDATSPKVKARLGLVRLELDYVRHVATVGHLYNAYLALPTVATRNQLLDAIDAWHAFLAALYQPDGKGGWIPGMRRGVIEGWPDFSPYLGHSRHAVALTRYYKDTPLNWNTEEMRKAPLAQAPGGGVADDFLSRQADAADRGAFGAPAGGSPVRRIREELYETTFRMPPEWDAVSNRLSAEAWGPWQFREDPADQGVDAGWYRPNWSTAGWTTIPVPAFWAETAVGDYLGYGWYRTTFTVPAEWEGKPVRLLFGSVDEQAWVYVNGELVRKHTTDSENKSFGALWDSPFTADVPADQLRYGAANVLAVRVHNKLGNGGIWRPVFVEGTE